MKGVMSPNLYLQYQIWCFFEIKVKPFEKYKMDPRISQVSQDIIYTLFSVTPLLHAMRRCMRAVSGLKWWRKYGRRWRRLAPSVLECPSPHRAMPFLPHQTLLTRRNFLLQLCHPLSMPLGYNKPSWASGLLYNRWARRHFLFQYFSAEKIKGMRWAEHATRMEENRHTYNVNNVGE